MAFKPARSHRTGDLVQQLQDVIIAGGFDAVDVATACSKLAGTAVQRLSSQDASTLEFNIKTAVKELDLHARGKCEECK